METTHPPWRPPTQELMLEKLGNSGSLSTQWIISNHETVLYTGELESPRHYLYNVMTVLLQDVPVVNHDAGAAGWNIYIQLLGTRDNCNKFDVNIQVL